MSKLPHDRPLYSKRRKEIIVRARPRMFAASDAEDPSFEHQLSSACTNRSARFSQCLWNAFGRSIVRVFVLMISRLKMENIKSHESTSLLRPMAGIRANHICFFSFAHPLDLLLPLPQLT